MNRSEIPVNDFKIDIFPAWADRWLLLTAGTADAYNTMTVAWGSLGVMWGKPFAQVVVRPSRHTFGFIEKHDTFTLTAFPDAMKDALTLCGTKSGRDMDKVAATGLTPVPSVQVEAPGFNEAELIIECRKTYHDTMKPANFLKEGIELNYKNADYHTIYFGEVLHITGTDAYRK